MLLLLSNSGRVACLPPRSTETTAEVQGPREVQTSHWYLKMLQGRSGGVAGGVVERGGSGGGQ